MRIIISTNVNNVSYRPDWMDTKRQSWLILAVLETGSVMAMTSDKLRGFPSILWVELFYHLRIISEYVQCLFTLVILITLLLLISTPRSCFFGAEPSGCYPVGLDTRSFNGGLAMAEVARRLTADCDGLRRGLYCFQANIDRMAISVRESNQIDNG